MYIKTLLLHNFLQFLLDKNIYIYDFLIIFELILFKKKNIESDLLKS